MPQMSQVLRECAIGMLTARMSNRAVARELNVNFSTRSCLQSHFREFGSMSNWPHNRRTRVWRSVGARFANVNIVKSAPWWQWGYGMGRHKLQSMNTIASYQWQFESTEKL
jgi:hypothetical protein